MLTGQGRSGPNNNRARLGPSPLLAISLSLSLSLSVLRHDSGYPLHTGLALYVHKSIENSVRRRLDLETEAIECIWVEINDSKTKPLLVGYVYRNPASSQGWPDDFISMMDKVTECNANILLLGDFNIDLFKQPPA